MSGSFCFLPSSEVGNLDLGLTSYLAFHSFFNLLIFQIGSLSFNAHQLLVSVLHYLEMSIFFPTFISHCVWNPRLAIIFFQVTEDIFLLWDYHFTIFWHPLFLLRNISLNVTSLKVIFFSPWLFVIYSFAIKKKIVVSFLMCLDVDFFLFNLFGILDSWCLPLSPPQSFLIES